jgi:hypothetical protein
MLKYIPVFLTVLSAVCAPAFAQEGNEPEETKEVAVDTSETTTETESAAE